MTNQNDLETRISELGDEWEGVPLGEQLDRTWKQFEIWFELCKKISYEIEVSRGQLPDDLSISDQPNQRLVDLRNKLEDKHGSTGARAMSSLVQAGAASKAFSMSQNLRDATVELRAMREVLCTASWDKTIKGSDRRRLESLLNWVSGIFHVMSELLLDVAAENQQAALRNVRYVGPSDSLMKKLLDD